MKEEEEEEEDGISFWIKSKPRIFSF